MYRRPNEWEQKAYQLLVMRYLIGLGDDLAPLRYRLLPPSQFINIEYYEERQRQRLPVDSMVGVHRGYLLALIPTPTPTLTLTPTLTRWACTAATSRRKATRWSTSSVMASCGAASRGMLASACSSATRAHARMLKAPSWRRHSSRSWPPGAGSRLLAPGCATHYSGRAAGPRKAHWEAAMRP